MYGGDIVAKMGRPPLGNDGRHRSITFRLSDEEADMLDAASAMTGKTRTRIFVDAIKAAYADAKIAEEVLKGGSAKDK